MKIELGLRENRRAFAPGETLDGAVLWELSEPPKRAEVNLLWFTRGKGKEDGLTVATQRFDAPPAADTRTFRFTLPDAPYSFTGRLVSLVWAVELIVEPGKHFRRVEIIVAPEGREIVLGEVVS